MWMVLLSAIVLLVAPSLALAASCGSGNRWQVKTMQDRPKLNAVAVPTSVDDLRAAQRQKGPNGTRGQGVESTKYSLTAELVEISEKRDGDIHLIIAQPGTGVANTIVVEFPNPKCIRKARAAARKKMKAARREVLQACPNPTRKGVLVNGTATIVGVGFFDFKHAQGHSDNAVELHPVLRFKGTCQRESVRP
jgi:hypothetical protein